MNLSTCFWSSPSTNGSYYNKSLFIIIYGNLLSPLLMSVSQLTTKIWLVCKIDLRSDCLTPPFCSLNALSACFANDKSAEILCCESTNERKHKNLDFRSLKFWI